MTMTNQTTQEFIRKNLVYRKFLVSTGPVLSEELHIGHASLMNLLSWQTSCCTMMDYDPAECNAMDALQHEIEPHC